MPYSTRTRDSILRRPIAAQNTIPDQDIWYQKGLDAEQARQDAEDYNWYASNYGVQQPDGSYFGPELRPQPQLDYDPSVRQVGQPMRRFEPYQQTPAWLEAVSDILVGYDPREGAENYDPEYDRAAWEDAWMLGMVPGVGKAAQAARLAGTAAFGGSIVNDARAGRIPGLIDATFLSGLPYRAARAAKNFAGAYKQRRALEKALRARALKRPDPNVRAFDTRRGRMEDIYVSPDMEFTPYEEVKFR